MRARSMLLAGWGNVPRQPAQVFRPETQAEARALVDGGVPPAAASLIGRGLGRAYGDAALNEGAGVVLCTRLDRLLAFDESTGMLECEGGTSLADILDVFLPRGFFPPVTPGTRFVTVGGAIAADVHGKNHHRDGSIAPFVEAFDLLTGRGQLLTCSRTQNHDAFRATLGGMGLTGIIMRARLRLRRVESAYIAVDYLRTASLEATLGAFAETHAAHEYCVAWIDCMARGASLGRSVLIGGRHAAIAELPAALQDNPLRTDTRRKRNIPLFLPNFTLSPWTVRLFNIAYYARHKSGSRLIDYDRFFYPLDSVGNWNRIYGRRGFFQYQAVLPAADGSTGIRRLLEALVASQRASFLAVLKQMGPASEGMLSFPMPGLTLALDLPNRGAGTIQLLRALDQIVLEHGGRVYLAKDACLSAEHFRAMYGSLGDFNAIRSRLDPDHQFQSSLSRRLGIGMRP